MKIKESFSHLLDQEKPLLPQLNKIKRRCFAPYKSNLQLLRYECEDCSGEGKFRSCLFYEATHLSCFSKHLKEIQEEKNIPKPKNFHKKTERLCVRKHPLETILKGTWAVFLHDREEPFNINTPEHKEWRQERKEIIKKLPCESDCKMVDYCAFYQNGVNVRLCFTEIESYDEDEVYYKKHTHDTDKGYIKDSYLYKNFIKGSKVRELPTVRTDGSRKKLDDYHYRIYEKIINAVKHQKKQKRVVLKGVLDSLLGKVETEEQVLKILNENSELDFQKIIAFVKKNGNLFSKNPQDLIEVNFTFWREWVKQRNLNFSDILYGWYLGQEECPSRKEIEERFKISQPSQIEIERRLEVRKEFKNIGASQVENNYILNSFCLGAVFRVLSQQERNKFLEPVRKRNNFRLATLQGITNNKNTTECDIIKLTGKILNT